MKKKPQPVAASRPGKGGDMEKEQMIEYIVNLLNAASPEKVRKLFICATNILT